jgi:hypothetical protein
MVPPFTGVPLALVLAPAELVAADPPLCGLDEALDEHAATASTTPASGTAQRRLLGMERTALLCSTCSTYSDFLGLARLPIVDYRPLGLEVSLQVGSHLRR